MKRIAVTGSNGYLGKRLCLKIQEIGGDPVKLSRTSDNEALRFQFGMPISHKALDGVDYLVHAAHDFGTKGDNSVRTNYEGSLQFSESASVR